MTATTEYNLRLRVANTIESWIGATKGSAKHLEILSIYNSYKPLARGYAVQPTDAYCATTVSAAFIKAGIAAYTGTECSCSYFIEIAKKRGYWTESDAYTPKLGDCVLYDWEDSGSGDNTGVPNHIGIVTKPGTTSFTVTEGNMSGGKVGQRTVQVNGKYIRGFITPDYAAIANAITQAELSAGTATVVPNELLNTATGPATTQQTVFDVSALSDSDILSIWDKILKLTAEQPLPEWAQPEFQDAIDSGITDGTRPMQPTPRYQAALMAVRAQGKKS